jgi:hypothetical protein
MTTKDTKNSMNYGLSNGWNKTSDGTGIKKDNVVYRPSDSGGRLIGNDGSNIYSSSQAKKKFGS